MSRYIYIGLLVGFLLAFAYYIGTNSFIFSIALFVITFMYFFLILGKRFIKFSNKVKRFHECYFFINNFIVGLSIKGSVTAALENLKGTISDDFQEEMESCEDMSAEEQLTYLQKYFPFHIYQLFMDIFLLWSEQGGDIIQMSTHLINQLRENEEFIVFAESNNRSHLVEFIILWAFSVAIVVALRFALSIFFESVSKQMLFQVGVFIVFLFIIASIEVMSRRMVNVEIKGANYES